MNKYLNSASIAMFLLRVNSITGLTLGGWFRGNSLNTTLFRLLINLKYLYQYSYFILDLEATKINIVSMD